jgi:hypothetical protein
LECTGAEDDLSYGVRRARYTMARGAEADRMPAIEES